MAQELEATTAEVAVPQAERPVAGWLALLQSLGPGRILALGVVLVALLAFFAFVALRVVEPRYTLLFGGLDPGDAATLVDRLEKMNVPYRLSDRGDAILVPEEDVTRLRMTLAADGMPAGEVVGYEVFDGANGFTTTDFLANVNLKRALEGELARTIASLREVRSARVHLVQPSRRLFERQPQQASASVFVSLLGGHRLEPRQVEGIRYLVASAVRGLSASRVTVMDDRGNLLARGGDDERLFALERAEEYRRAYEDRMRRKLIELLERTVGVGRVDAQVTAEMDFDEVSVTRENYDPEGKVPRSSRVVEENTRRSETAGKDAVTVSNNLPAARQQSAGGDQSSEAVERTDETVNYEVSRTVETQRRHGGRIRRISVAIQVDGKWVPGADGKPVFQPLGRDELSELEALARGALMIDDERGDKIEIVSRPFVTPEVPPPAPESWLDLLTGRYGRYVEALLWLLLGIAVLQFGFRPLVQKLTSAARPALEPARTAVIQGPDGKPLLVHGTTGTAVALDERGQPVVVQTDLGTRDGGQLVSSGSGGQQGAGGAARDGDGEDGGELTTLAQVAGKVKSSLVKEVADILEEQPDEAVRVIRTWLHEGDE